MIEARGGLLKLSPSSSTPANNVKSVFLANQEELPPVTDTILILNFF